MAVNVYEKFQSRERTWADDALDSQQDQADLGYIIQGTDDDEEAKIDLSVIAPATFRGLLRLSMHIEPIGPQLWDAKVRYGRPEKQQQQSKETGEMSVSFDTTGTTQHITQALQHVATYQVAGGTPAPDAQGAIGVTHDSVEGVDITVPAFGVSVTRYIAATDMTSAYVAALYSLTGRVNQATFSVTADGVTFTFQAGECLFLGASGSKRGAGDWELSYKFAGSPNVTGMSVGPITGIDKKGWEYLWVRYQDTKDDAAHDIIKRPVGVYVEKVYRDGDFAALAMV